jgi:NitT/TauT family transport system substrate-binding protein
MASDTIDFANCGTAPIIINQSQGLDLDILAGSNQEGTSLVVVDSIKSVMDLDGRTIATPGLGSIQDAMLARLAMENDISIERTTMDVSDMPDFLQKEEIDGFIAWAPHPAIAATQKFGHELLTSKDMMPGHQCCVLVTKSATSQNDRDTASKVLEVYLDAYKWFLENRDESIQMIVKATGTSEAVINQAITAVEYSYPPDCNTESMRSVAQGLIDAGRITALNETEIDDFIMDIYKPELMETITKTKRP